MGVSFNRIHVEYGPEPGRERHHQLHQLLVSYVLHLGCGLRLHTSDSLQLVAHFQGVLFSETHQGCRHKNPPCPSLKGTFSLIAVQPCEEGYEPILKDIFSRCPVTDIPYADGKHTGSQTIIKDLLSRPISFLAGFNQLKVKGFSHYLINCVRSASILTSAPKRCTPDNKCCIQGKFFQRCVFFPDFEYYFCTISSPYSETMTRLQIILLTFVTLFIIPFYGVSAQTPQAQDENLIVSAVTLYDAGDFDGAAKILRPIIERNPKCDAAYYYLALCSLAKGDAELGEAYFREAVAIDPGNFWYRHRLAALYAATKRPELAISIYEKLLKDFPKKSDLYFELVELYVAQGENDKALKTLDEIETVFGKTESITVYRFNLLRRMNRAEEAFKSLEEYNQEYTSPYVLTALADWQISMYNDSTALRYYDEALEAAPDYAPALLGKAETLRMTRKYNDYFKVLDKFVSDPFTPVEGKSDYLMAIIQRTDPKFMRSFMSQMDSVVVRTLQVHPSDSTAMNLAGVWYYSTDRRDEAGEWFRRNAETYSESLAASASYVEYLMYAEKWDELSAAGRSAFERFPEETAFLEMASVGDFNLKRYDSVLAICDQVLEIAPEDTSKTLRAWSTKGDIYYKLGDSKKAYKAYDKALKINPDNVYVLNNYAYYLSEGRKKLKKAYEMSKKVVEVEPDNATYLDTFGWILFLQGKALEAKPFFKKAMLYGGKDSAVIMDHYAEVLYALKEYDLAFVYWNLAKKKNVDGEIPDLDARVAVRKKEMKK